MANYTASDPEVTGITAYASAMLGAPVINVELDTIQYVHALMAAIL